MKCETCAHFKACKRLIDERYEELVPCEEYQSVYTVDAAPVVRCGECINYGYRNRHWDDICLKNEPKGCRKWLDKEGMFIIDNPNDFCSYGERKEPTNGIE